MSHPIAPIPWSVTLPDGQKEKFSIKPPTISKLYDWLHMAKNQNEVAMVAMAIGKDIEWIDSNIDIDQFAKLAAECHKLIFPMAIRLAKGAPAAAALLAPVFQDTELGWKVNAILSDGSGDLSPTPPQSASAPATPSASPTPTPSPASAPLSQPTTATPPPAS